MVVKAIEVDRSQYDKMTLLDALTKGPSEPKYAHVPNLYTSSDHLKILKLLASSLPGVTTSIKPDIVSTSTAINYTPFM